MKRGRGCCGCCPISVTVAVITGPDEESVQMGAGVVVVVLVVLFVVVVVPVVVVVLAVVVVVVVVGVVLIVVGLLECSNGGLLIAG